MTTLIATLAAVLVAGTVGFIVGAILARVRDARIRRKRSRGGS